MQRVQGAEEAKFKMMKDQVNKLNDGVQKEQESREIMDEKKQKEIKLSENNINIELNVEK